MQHLNNGFNKFKMWFDPYIHVDSSRDVKNFTKPFKYNCKHQVTCVSICTNKCKMQLVSNNFNILKLNGLVHVHMLIVEEMWTKSLIHFNINGGS
jgi:hypothetical protein